MNTIRDLFNLNIDQFNPVKSFPKDQVSHHMDNIGQKLVTSGFLLDQIIQSADQVVEQAMMPRTKPEQKSWTFNKNFYPGQELRGPHKKGLQL